MPKRKPWSKSFDESGFRVRLYERKPGGTVQYSYWTKGSATEPAVKVQRSTRRSNRKAAEEFVREALRLAAQGRPVESREQEPRMLSEVFDAYRHAGFWPGASSLGPSSSEGRSCPFKPGT